MIRWDHALHPHDLASERWLRGRGGVLDAIRAEIAHIYGLTVRELRHGARPRRRASSACAVAIDRSLARIDARDSLDARLAPLTARERDSLWAWAVGEGVDATAARWGTHRSRVSQVRTVAWRKVGAA